MPKYSIITVACNGIHLTTKCVESILKYTKDFELIVVDSNTTDGTRGYLTSIAEQNLDIIKIIEHDKKLSFAENNNLGLQLAKGRYVIFLNNDTVVTPDWLERMEPHFYKVPLPNIGAIGPVSCMSNGIQMVGEQNSEQWHQANLGKWKHTGILYGWCQMWKKEVLDKIGGFDERFENSYEDNDLCLRAQLAGYNLCIAYDTYIFHLGQGTIRQGMSIEDYDKNGRKNRELYFNKYWEPEKKRKLVAVYRTNGGEWLERSLEQTSKFADSIIIHFCRSERFDIRTHAGAMNLATLQEQFPKIVKFGHYEGIFQEDYERGWLLQEALKLQEQGLADWCISVDDDELYEDKFVERVQKMMSPRNPETFGYWCNWRTIWRTELGKEYYRTDSTFGSFTNYRFYRLIPGQRIVSFHPEGHHCGSAPWLPDENLRWCSIRVKHMGYDTPEQRQKKYEFYEANDHFKTKADIGYEDYSHLISLNPKLQEYRKGNGISLVCMVKNEEENIEGMLENVQHLVDEYVIVDTGSTDKTLEILKRFQEYSIVPVKIFEYPWADMYALPRNFGKSKATKEWIMFLDADERFRPQDVHLVFKESESDADIVVFNVNNYMERPQKNKDLVTAPTQSARLFKNIPELYFTGYIHETIDEARDFLRKRRKVASYISSVTLHHYGYLKKKSKLRDKLDYYEQLNLKQLEITEEKDCRVYFNLALHYLNDGKENKALECFQKCLKINPKFYHASQQMAALNVNSAKHFLLETLKYMPDSHPIKKQTLEMYQFIESKSKGFVKVA